MLIEFKEKVTRIVADVEESAKNYVLLPSQSRLTMICNCPGRHCRYTDVRRLTSNEISFEATSCLDAMESFLGYKLSAIPDQADSQNNYSGVVIKNLINHLKILTLHSSLSSPSDSTSTATTSTACLDETEEELDAYEWATCNETFYENYQKLLLNFRLAGSWKNKDTDYCYKVCSADRLVKYLDGLDPRHVLEETQLMIGHFDKFVRKPQALLERINSSLFGGEVTGLRVRWGNCQRYIAELDLERTCSGRVHIVLKLNKLKKDRAIEVIQVMMIEMVIFFLNKSFDSELRTCQLNKIFSKLQDYMSLILIKFSNLTQLDLTRPYGIDRVQVYTFQVRADPLDRRCQNLIEILSASSTVPLNSKTFQLDLYYLLPYFRKNHEMPFTHSYNVFGRPTSPQPFDIEPRQSVDTYGLNINDQERISNFAKTLLKHLEADLTYPDDLNDYVQLSECGDGLIVTTEITRIEHKPHSSHLLLTPPGTTRSFETSTRNRRVSLERRAKSARRAPIPTEMSITQSFLPKLSVYKIPTLSEGIHTWQTWINQLKATTTCIPPPPFSLLEADSGVDVDASAEHEHEPTGFSQCRHSLMTLMGLLLKKRAQQPTGIRTELCEYLAGKEALGLEDKIGEFFMWMDQKLFFGLLRDVRVEWSYRLKSTAACTVLEKEPQTHVVIRLSWNLLTRLQIIEIAKMLLHEMIHAFLGLAIGDFCERHDLNYTNILRQINYILKLNIPIEHDYEETMELAYVWKCTKCAEKRVRFYNIPPTDLQKEKHGLKCDGSLLRTATPKIFRR